MAVCYLHWILASSYYQKTSLSASLQLSTLDMHKAILQCSNTDADLHTNLL